LAPIKSKDRPNMFSFVSEAVLF